MEQIIPSSKPAEQLPERTVMTDEQAAVVFGAISLGTKALLITAFDRNTALDAEQINEHMSPISATCTDWEPSREYYPQICRYLSQKNVGIFHNFIDPSDSKQKWALTEAGYYIVRPPAVQFALWSALYDIPLRKVWGETRNTGNESASILNRIAILQHAASGNPISSTTIEQMNPDFISEKGIRVHLEKLRDSGIFETLPSGTIPGDRAVPHRIKPEHLSAIQEMLDLVQKTVTCDPDFYYEGSAIASLLMEDPEIIAILTSHMESTSNRINGRRKSYQTLCDRASRLVARCVEPLSQDVILSLYADGMDTNQRSRFLHNLRKLSFLKETTDADGNAAFIATEHARWLLA